MDLRRLNLAVIVKSVMIARHIWEILSTMWSNMLDMYSY